MVDKFPQTNKPNGRLGEARQSGNSAVVAELNLLSRWVSIFWITTGSSMLAMILTSPPHSLQVSISILKTRFNRFAQVIEALFSAGVWSDSFGDLVFMHLPRLAGVTRARYLLLGAKTPWKRVRLTLGLGTKATNLDMAVPVHPCTRGISESFHVSFPTVDSKGLHLRYGPGQPLDRFPVSPSPRLSG